MNLLANRGFGHSAFVRSLLPAMFRWGRSTTRMRARPNDQRCGGYVLAETFAETMKTLAAHEGNDFIAFCEALSQSLKNALKEFRKEFLSDLSALSEGDRLSAQKREQQSFIHARAGIERTLLSDPKIKQDRLTGAMAPEVLAALVWETLIDSARDDMDYDKTLFELLRSALY